MCCVGASIGKKQPRAAARVIIGYDRQERKKKAKRRRLESSKRRTKSRGKDWDFYEEVRGVQRKEKRKRTGRMTEGGYFQVVVDEDEEVRKKKKNASH